MEKLPDKNGSSTLKNRLTERFKAKTTGVVQKTRIPPRPVTLITENKPARMKEEVQALWRDDERERKRSDNYRAYKLLRKDIKERLKNGEKISH